MELLVTVKSDLVMHIENHALAAAPIVCAHTEEESINPCLGSCFILRI